MRQRRPQDAPGTHRVEQEAQRPTHGVLGKMDQRSRRPRAVKGARSKGERPHVRLDQRQPAAPAPGVDQQRPGKIDRHNLVAGSAPVEAEEMPRVLPGPASEIEKSCGAW